MERGNWMNLNGLWQCRQGFENDPVPAGQNLSQEILVPFCVESALSGIREDWRRIWYRRTLTLPKQWSGKKRLLHFGAVDWESEVFVNGRSTGIHKDGYDPFSYEITSSLSKGNQEIIVRVYAPTDSDSATAFKKQLLQAFKGPGFDGTRYAPVSGIWQTVWLETVSETYIEDLKLVPDIDNHQLNLNVNVSGTII